VARRNVSPSLPLTVTRRALLTAAVGIPAMTLSLSACGRSDSNSGDDAPGDTDSRTRLAETESRLLVAHDLVIARLSDGPERQNLVRRRRRHVWHLEHILATGAINAMTNATTLLVDAPTTNEPTQLMRWIASNERAASLVQSGVTSRTTDLTVARIAALTSAFERTHGIVDLATVQHKDWSPASGASVSEVVESLSDALEIHYAALWAMGRLGPLLTAGDAGRARRFTVEHVSARDRIRRALLSAGSTPPSPAPTYSLTGQPRDPSAARSVLRDTERSLAAAWLTVIAAARAQSDSATASAATALLGDAAIRAHAWGNREAFPGFGDRLQYLS
jgi:hypothetical protein